MKYARDSWLIFQVSWGSGDSNPSRRGFNPRSLYLMLSQEAVRVCSVIHLIELKQLAGRPRDIEGLENLGKILEKRLPGEKLRN